MGYNYISEQYWFCSSNSSIVIPSYIWSEYFDLSIFLLASYAPFFGFFIYLFFLFLFLSFFFCLLLLSQLLSNFPLLLFPFCRIVNFKLFSFPFTSIVYFCLYLCTQTVDTSSLISTSKKCSIMCYPRFPKTLTSNRFFLFARFYWSYFVGV